MFKKLFSAALVVLLLACSQLAAATTTVSVSATPNNPVAPATVTLAITATTDGDPVMATQVEYLNGTASLGVAVQAPFTLVLDNVAAGTYQVTAKVTTTDPNNPVLQSSPLTVTVGTTPGAVTAYFIHTDQLNTPRAISNGSGNLVWQWDSDPFGKDAASEQPRQPAFTFNQRFPGQQFDRESNLHYNYFRDYDPALGRYIESDPIGLNGGINTYGYVGESPTNLTDPLGLQALPASTGGVVSNVGRVGQVAVGAAANDSSFAIVGRAAAFCGPICVGIIAAVTPSEAGRGSDIVQAKPIRSPEEERMAQGEHDWYKSQCEDKKITTGDKCLDLLNEANRAWTCSNSMLQWDERWQPGRHDRDIAIQEQKYHRLMKAYKECKKKTCP